MAKLAFNPIAELPSWQQRALVLLPAIPLLWISDLTAVLWLGSTALILWLSQSARQSTFQMIYKNVWVTIGLGITVGTVVGLLVNPALDGVIESMTGSEIDLSQFADVEGDVGAFVELLIVAILVGGIVEEITFRGFFIGWGTRLFGMKAALPLLLLSSIAFGVGHLYQGLAGGISATVFASLMGVIYLALGRKLLPLIIIHSVSNFWGVLALYRYGI